MWNRRQFLQASGLTALLRRPERKGPVQDGRLVLFLCGDVMTGRGIDQVLPHPSKPRIYESHMTSAQGYVELAERAFGPIPRSVDFSYVWGDALAELERRAPGLRIVNLETSVTVSEEARPKGINYRMHPRNVPCLRAAGIDCTVLANNHVLDWGFPGLRETLTTLREAGLATAGAGQTSEEAERPAVLERPGQARVLVFGFGSPTSGIPSDWAATRERPGVRLLEDLSARTAKDVTDQIRRWRRPGDRVVASVHWGGNWGYAIPREQREFAQRLVDEAGVDVVHGHSSHHAKGIEVHEGRLIFYGCGDFLNDYEGISGYEEYRSDLVLAYFVTLDDSGRLVRLEMSPFESRRFRLQRGGRPDAEWLARKLDREGRPLGTKVELTGDGALALAWS